MEYLGKTQPLPNWVQDQFLPLWKTWLKEYDETGFFKGSDETGKLPTRFALWAMGCEQATIEKYYPTKKHSFITIRLDNEVPLEKIQEKIQNINLKWMTIAYARLELFSTNMTRNHHVHILSSFAVKTRIIRDLSRYFKVPKQNIDVKHGEKCELYDTRYNYIQGDKKELKSEAISADQKELDEKNIQQIYAIENI